MGAVVFIGIFVLALSLYAYSSARIAGMLGKGREKVISVEAGPVTNSNAKGFDLASYTTTSRPIIDERGKSINIDNTLRISVNGNSMRPAGIRNGDELIVQKIDKAMELSKQIKKGDILLIFSKESGVNKIRVFDGFNGDGSVITYRFENEDKIYSTHPYDQSNIIGVVKYLIEKK